jgi:hypothetical protein
VRGLLEEKGKIQTRGLGSWGGGSRPRGKAIGEVNGKSIEIGQGRRKAWGKAMA